MYTTVQKWGNSHAVRLPKIVLDSVSIKENDPVEIFAVGDTIVIQKASRKRYAKKSLGQRLEEFYKKPVEEVLADNTLYTPVETDWGEPVGKEVW